MAAILSGHAPPARRFGLQAELAAQAAAATAAEHADEVARIEAELLEDAGVLLRVDLVGQLAVGLLGLVVLPARAQQLEDLFLGDLHEKASVDRMETRGCPERAAANAAASLPERPLPAVVAAASRAVAAPLGAAARVRAG